MMCIHIFKLVSTTGISQALVEVVLTISYFVSLAFPYFYFLKIQGFKVWPNFLNRGAILLFCSSVNLKKLIQNSGTLDLPHSMVWILACYHYVKKIMTSTKMLCFSKSRSNYYGEIQALMMDIYLGPFLGHFWPFFAYFGVPLKKQFIFQLS